MNKVYLIRYFIFVLVFGFISKKSTGQTSPTDYFRSAQSGQWDVIYSWESSTDGVSWIPATSAPSFNANTITIRSGHSITITNSNTVDQVIVTSGGILDLATSASSILTVNNGTGADITVQNGGTFRHNIAANSSLPSFSGSATLEIQSGAILEAANNNGTASHYANVTSDIASNVIWQDGAVFHWNNLSTPAEGITYFPAASAIPVFRISQPITIGGSAGTVINGLLEANSNVSFQGGGSKTFRNGITGTGKVGVTALNGGQFIINGATATLGGTGILELNDKGLSINSGTALTLTSNKTINNYPGGTGSITNSGTFILDNYTINGNSKIKIDGTVKTTNINGLTGGVNTAFATASGFTVNTLGTSSTVEYNALGNQAITLLTYYNLTVSGTGTKTAASGADIFVSGALNIMSGNTFALNGTNNLKLNGGGTVNISANSILDNGGESEISGGSSPVVNISGTFITRDADGFSGSNASISGNNIAINILPGSTIEYGRAGDQIVTKRDDYKNLTFSGSGVKTIPTCRPIGTVTIKDYAIADASNKTFGDTTATNLIMTGGRFKVGGSGTKPDILGTYNLTGGVIEFTTSGLTAGTIRSPLTYFNIEVSGTNVSNSKGITTLANGGSFTVKTRGVFENSGYRIDGFEGVQTFILEAGSIFKTGVKGGFSGNDSAAIKNIETFIIDPKSTVVYSRGGNQTITPLNAYPTLQLRGSGIKTVSQGTATISPVSDTMLIDTAVIFKVSSGAIFDFQNNAAVVRSRMGGTGIIGEISEGPSGLLNATNVTVERFIPAKKAFRFLSPAVTTNTSIRTNWMEGGLNPDINTRVNPHPGFGTNITGSNPTTNEFDPTITNNPSMLTFDYPTQQWLSIPNTKGTLKAGDAYLVAVRGDRTIVMTDPSDDPPPTNTILRTTGALYSGKFSPTLSTVDKHYTFIGNPYASPVDWEKMVAYDLILKRVTGTANNISATYFTYEPKINRRGTYVYYNAVSQSNSNPSSLVDKNIQPGQAIFVQTIGSNPKVEFNESYKSTSLVNVFRNPSQLTKLSVQLLLNLNPGLENTADAVTAFFDEQFSKEMGNEDSYKFTNPDENIAIQDSEISLSMEGRPLVTAEDSVPLKMWQLKFEQKTYYIKIIATNFSPDVTAFLKDTYLKQLTQIDLSSTSTLPFSIDSSISESYASDRFTIVFKPANVLPITLANIKAYQKDDGIQVDWTAETEININSYEVEKSIDGQQFYKGTNVLAKDNNSFPRNYNWLDENISIGSNFYRIKMIYKSGAIKYSNVVKVNLAKINSNITVFPNPIKGNIIQFKLSNMQKGRYTAVLYNTLGQKMYTGAIEQTARTEIHTISLGRVISKGTYRLNVSNKNNGINTILISD